MKFKTTQKVVEYSTVLLFLIGVFWIIFGAVLFAKNNSIQDSSEYNAFKIGLYLSIGFGVLLVVWSLVGLLAACRKLNCLLGTYNVGIVIILLISVSLLIVSIAVAAGLPGYKDDRFCTKKSLLQDLAQLNQKSVATLCQTPCVCQYEGIADTTQIKNFSKTSGALRVQDCAVFDSFDVPNKKDNSNLLRSFEETFDCSGFCSVNPYYVFSNVNGMKPTKDCKVEVLNFLSDNVTRLLVASAIITFILIFIFIFTICLCCKKPKGETYYSRNNVGYNGAKN